MPDIRCMDRRKLKTGLITAGVLLLITPLTLRLLGFGATKGIPEDAAYFPVQDTETGKWGFIDAQGGPLTPVVFEWAGDFRHGRGLAQATVGGRHVMGYIDESFEDEGDWAIAPRFVLADAGDVAARGFFDGLAAARDENGKWGYIDPEGAWAIEPTFETIGELPTLDPCGDFSDGLAWFVEAKPSVRNQVDEHGELDRDENGDLIDETYLRIRYGYISRSGKVVIPPRYELAQDFGEGLAGVEFTGSAGWGFIDRKGDREISPRFEGVGRFSQRLCPVKEHGLWGYIDPEGEWVIEPTFAEAREFSADGLAPARRPNEKWGYINRRGVFVIPPRYDDDERPGMYNDPRPFENGVARVMLNGTVRYIRTDGSVVWPND